MGQQEVPIPCGTGGIRDELKNMEEEALEEMEQKLKLDVLLRLQRQLKVTEP